MKTGGLEPIATALAGRHQQGAVDVLWLDLAKKADGASFDTVIWAVGGDAAGLKEAREAIREGLHVLRKEGQVWLVKHACEDSSAAKANRLTTLDYLRASRT
jgi:hypothetical protein